MNDNIIIAGLFPHPPIAIPGVGRGRERDCEKTMQAMAELARDIVAAKPDAVVLLSPHSPRKPKPFGVWNNDWLEGSLVLFGKPDAKVKLPNDKPFIETLGKAAGENGVELWYINSNFTEDHGAVVPLWYLYDAGWRGPTCVISMNYPGAGGLEELGKTIAQAAGYSGQRIALVASGDMSHRLKPGAPAGYHERAVEFDKKFVELIKEKKYRDIAKIDAQLRELAAEDVADTTVVALAACDYDTTGAKLISYEGPFGVGYTIALLCDRTGEKKPQTAPATQKAEKSEKAEAPDASKEDVENYKAGKELLKYAKGVVEAIAKHEKEPAPPAATGLLAKRAGVFVTIYTKNHDLRGCVGTIGPTQKNVVAETRHSAEMAAFEDRRFRPVSDRELDNLVYEISILHEPEPVKSKDELDSDVYGIIITARGGRRALMLPGIETLDTVDKQLSATRMKAGIGPSEEISIQRFKVDKIK